MKRLGSAGKDISALFVYVCLHEYCSGAGLLGFVITQTVFQSTASDEFRRFVLPGGTPFRVKAVDDWVRVSPFTGAANKTATFVAEKGEEAKYPVQYRVWATTRDFDRDSTPTDEAFKCLAAETRWARPSDPDRPESLWTIGADEDDRGRASAEPARKYEIRRGVETGLESAFRVRILKTLSKNECLVENITERARKPLPSVSGKVELERVFPYITGSSIGLFRSWSTGCYLVPHTAETGMTPLSEATMKRQWDNTFSFLRQFEADLQERNIHKRWGKGNPFYSLYNIGPYTFSPWKVVWKRTTKNFEAAVASVLPVINDQMALAIPNGKVMMIPFDDATPAHFVCAVINSSPARLQINSGISSEAHAEILSLISIPSFSDSNPVHRNLVDLSVNAHIAASAENLPALEQALNAIDEQVGRLWGLARNDVTETQKRLGESRVKLRRLG